MQIVSTKASILASEAFLFLITHEIYYEKFIQVQFLKIDHYARPVVFYFLPEVYSTFIVTILYENLHFVQFTYFFLRKELVTDSFLASESTCKVFKLAELYKNSSGATQLMVSITFSLENTTPIFI